MNRKKFEGGYIKGFFILLLLAAIVFVLVSLGKPYFRYYQLGSYTRDVLKSEIGNLETISERIMTEAKALQIPLEEENLEVTLDKKIIRVNAVWSETVDFWGYYQKKFDFNMNEEY